MMQRLTRRVLRHKRLVAVGLDPADPRRDRGRRTGLQGAGPALQRARPRGLGGQPGDRADLRQRRRDAAAGAGGDAAAGQDRGLAGRPRRAARARGHARSKAVPGSRVAGFGSTGDRAFTSRDGRTAFVYVFSPRSDDPFGSNVDVQRELRAALRGASVGGAPVRLTGYDALADSSGAGDDGPGVLLEAVIGGVGALVVLLFVFGSALAFVPLGMAISSVLVSFLLLWGLTAITEVSPIVQFLVALIGLGLAIDYALLIVVRWREERERGLEGDEAVIAAMGTAGRAVVFSGTTVAVGLLALVVLPLPFLRSMGYGGMLIPLVATSVAITLLPVILATVGPRMDRRRLRRRDNSHAFWQRWSEAVVRRRWVAAIVAVAVLVALAGAATNLHLGNADPDTIAKAGPAKDGLDALDRSGIGKGAIAPVETLVARGRRGEGRRRAGARRRACTARSAPSGRRLATRRAAPSSSRAARRATTPRPAATRCRTCATRRTRASPQARVGGSRPAQRRLHRRRLRLVPADDRADLDRSPSCCSRARSARCCCR